MGTPVLPAPVLPYNPQDPTSVVVWNNYWLSLQNIATDNAPTNAQYFVATANSILTNERNLGSLVTGFLFITVAAGIAVPSSTMSGAGLTNLNADNLSTGTVPNARFPAVLPAVNGSLLTNLTAASIVNAPGLTYTPTRSAEVNLDSNVTPSVAQYARLGNFVMVTGRFTADPTTTLTPTSFELSLPIASNIGAVADCAGVAFCGAIQGQGAAISGSIANNTAVFSWLAVDVTSQAWSYSYSYQVI